MKVSFEYSDLHVIQVEINMLEYSLLGLYVISLRHWAVKECEAPVHTVLFVVI